MSENTDALFEQPEQKEVKRTVDLRPAPKFRRYEQDKEFLFPESTAKYLPHDHIARLLSAIIDRVDISGIEDKYKGGGASAYHPRLMLKLWLLGFIYRIYSTRQLARQTAEHVAFIWISGGATPDFHTLNNFRLNLESDMKTIFREIVQLALKLEMIDGKDIFLDHSKMEANANRHKIVWKKNTERYTQQIEEELARIFRHVKEVDEQENRIFSKKVDLSKTEFSDESVSEMVGEINARLKNKSIDKEKAQAVKNDLRKTKKLNERKEKYAKQKEILGERNSYSKTDEDATAMRQKDHVSTKPGYNVGITTQNQIVTNYGVTNTVSENTNFKDLIQGAQENTGVEAETVIADSGYGNEENYEYLKEEGLTPLVSYNTYHKEKSKAWREKMIRRADFQYEPQHDQYRCPAGQPLKFEREIERKSATGHIAHSRIYRASSAVCGICPLKEKCTAGRSRSLAVNARLEELKREARRHLQRADGRAKYKQRSIEVEPIFGHTFHNKSRRRFLLRGLPKVDIEAGIAFTAGNIGKIYQYLLKIRPKLRIHELPLPAIG